MQKMMVIVGATLGWVLFASPAGASSWGKDYLIGASVVHSTAHTGKIKGAIRLKPMFYFEYGGFRISRSRSDVIMAAGRGEGLETGISKDFLTGDSWSLGGSLRFDNGRSFDGDPRWSRLPDIEETVRGRLSARKRISDRTSINITFDHDLLNRKGGARLGASIGYRLPISNVDHWDFSVHSGLGNARYMQTQYGVSEGAARLLGGKSYRARSGMENLRVGFDYTHAVNQNWVAFGGIGFSRLLQSAAGSPLVDRKSTYSVSVGLAWRTSR